MKNNTAAVCCSSGERRWSWTTWIRTSPSQSLSIITLKKCKS